MERRLEENRKLVVCGDGQLLGRVHNVTERYVGGRGSDGAFDYAGEMPASVPILLET
jgi:hypothetical protein